MSSALGIGTTGLNASQKQMDVIGNNLANANTVGFKAAETQFADMLSHSLNGGSGKMQVGQGVAISSVSTRFDQGSFETTGSVTDLAIDGEGFFPVKDKEGALFYTRAGAFHIDKDGYLVDVNSYRAQGLNLFSATGDEEITDICLQNVQSAPSSSTTFKIGANLNESDAPDTEFVVSQSVFDSKGEIHNLSLIFNKTADAGKWTCQATLDEVDSTAQSITEIQFDANGKLQGVSANPTFTFGTLPNGASIGVGGVLTWNLTGKDAPLVTGYAATSVIKTLEADGYASGVLKNLTVSKNGVISGVFTNGQTSDLGQVVLANFPNVAGLTRLGSYFGETNVSGQPIINKPGTGGLGEVMSNSLEQSNIDVSKEFVNMINAQKAYQANARIITAADEMLTELMNIKR